MEREPGQGVPDTDEILKIHSHEKNITVLAQNTKAASEKNITKVNSSVKNVTSCLSSKSINFLFSQENYSTYFPLKEEMKNVFNYKYKNPSFPSISRNQSSIMNNQDNNNSISEKTSYSFIKSGSCPNLSIYNNSMIDIFQSQKMSKHMNLLHEMQLHMLF